MPALELPDHLRAQLGERPGEAVVGGVAVALARRAGLDPVEVVAPPLLEAADADVPDELAVPVDLLGMLYEQSQNPDARRRAGAHYTPADVARRLVALVRERRAEPGERIGDPSVGGGAFLLAAARALEADGLDRAEIVTRRLHGIDLDPVSVAVARTSLSLWAGVPSPDEQWRVADALVDPLPWVGEIDVVVGNPPFLSPLARANAPDQARRQQLRARFGSAFGPYVDAAALFLLVGLELLAPTGSMALLQPLSFLAARDTEEVRRRLLDRARLRGLWVAGEPVFDAAVDVCAPILDQPASPGPLRVYQGRGVHEVAAVDAPAADRLASVAAPVLGIPAAPAAMGPTLGDQATIVAGFRDEFYAIAAAVTEGGPGPRVVTAGRIGPLRLDPDGRPVRIHGNDYRDPRLDVGELEETNPRVAAWVARLSVPKVLIATQTPVIEAVVDPDGSLVPLTPVIAIVPEPDDVWAVAARLTAPSISAWAAARTIGLGRHRRVIKLAARDLRAVPAAEDPAAWRVLGDVARMAQAASRDEWARQLVDLAHRADAALEVSSGEAIRWWLDRLGLDAEGFGLRPGR